MKIGRFPVLTARRAALIVFALALAVRLLYVTTLPAAPFLHNPHSDHASYFAWAELLAAGRAVPLDNSIQQPAYALLLTPWLRLSCVDPVPVTRALHGCTGALGAGLLTLLAARCLPPRWAMLAGLLYALSPMVVFTDLTWSKEQLALNLWLAALLLLTRPGRGARFTAIVLALLAIGLREIFIVPVMLAASAFFPPRTAWRRLAPVVLLALIALWGWGMLHAALRCGNPPQGFAEPLYVGIWPGTGILYQPPAFVRPGRIYEAVDWQAETARRLGRAPSPAEENAYWLNAARAELAAHPSATLQIMAQRIAAGLWAGPLEDNYPYLVHYWSSPVLPWLPPVWLLFALGLGGLAVWWRAGESRLAWCVVTAIVLGTLLAPAPFYVLERLRLPLYAAFAVAAAAGLQLAPRVPKYWLLTYAAGVAVAVSPALTARLAPAVLAGARLGWHVLSLP